MADYQSLANAGIRFDLLTSPSGQDLANTLAPDIANIAALAQSNPGSVLSVEAPNELNGQIVYLNGASSSDPATGAAIARAVSQAVHNNATLTAQNVDVVNVSLTNGMGGWENYLAGLGNLSASVDYGNWHVYFNGGTQPLANLTSMYQLRNAVGSRQTRRLHRDRIFHRLSGQLRLGRHRRSNPGQEHPQSVGRCVQDRGGADISLRTDGRCGESIRNGYREHIRPVPC